MNLQLIALLSVFFVANTDASSLRGDRKLHQDRSKYSVGSDRGGGASSRSSSSSSATSLSALYSSIMAGTDPFPSDLVTGTDDDLFLGYSVSYAGDVNGDGIDDVIVGGPQKNLDEATLGVGAAFVIFGAKDTLPNIPSIDSLDGTNGFAFFGSYAGSDTGFVVSTAGDVNGDGFDDVIIGAPNTDGSGIYGSGEAYVVFGGNNFPAYMDASDLDGTMGFVIQGNDVEDHLGSSVSTAGDVNGDGINDIIVGAPNAGIGGEAYVIFGSTTPYPEIVFVSGLGSSGITVKTAGADYWLGLTVAAAGDVNGDGKDDFLVSAPQAADGFGAVYVIYGTNAASVPVSSLQSSSGQKGYTIYGTHEAAKFGLSLAPLGDVNGDSIDDFVVGCPHCREGGLNDEFDQGAAFIFLGSTTSPADSLDASDAASTLWGSDAFDWVGVDVASAGDVNGDGINDIAVGASRSVYSTAILCVIYGGSLQPTLHYEDIDNTDQGKIVNLFSEGYDGKNDNVMSVSNAGDFNGDGIQDLIIGLPDVDPGTGPEYAEGHVKVLIVHQEQF